MSRPLPAALAEVSLASQASPPATEDVLRVLGGIGLPGDTELTRIPAAAGSLPEAVSSWEVPEQAHAATTHLFSEAVVNRIRVPGLDEFARAGVDFESLRSGFEAYEQAGMSPQLVFAPINLTVDDWQGHFDSLCDYQEQRGSARSQGQQLKRQSDGNGLYISDPVKEAWDDLNDQVINTAAGKFVHMDDKIWGVWVIPTAGASGGGLAVNVSHDLTSGDLDPQSSIISQPTTAINQENAHMPVGAYLTAQAVRVVENEPFIDTDGNWTWNAGVFDEGGVLRAPVSKWRRAVGQVRVGRDGVGFSYDYLGVRLPVWG